MALLTSILVYFPWGKWLISFETVALVSSIACYFFGALNAIFCRFIAQFPIACLWLPKAVLHLLLSSFLSFLAMNFRGVIHRSWNDSTWRGWRASCMSSSFCFKLLFFISKFFFRITGLLIVFFVKVIAIITVFFIIKWSLNHLTYILTWYRNQISTFLLQHWQHNKHIDYKPKNEKEHKEINTNYSTSSSKGQNVNILNTRHLFHNLDKVVIIGIVTGVHKGHVPFSPHFSQSIRKVPLCSLKCCLFLFMRVPLRKCAPTTFWMLPISLAVMY